MKFNGIVSQLTKFQDLWNYGQISCSLESLEGFAT